MLYKDPLLTSRTTLFILLAFINLASCTSAGQETQKEKALKLAISVPCDSNAQQKILHIPEMIGIIITFAYHPDDMQDYNGPLFINTFWKATATVIIEAHNKQEDRQRWLTMVKRYKKRQNDSAAPIPSPRSQSALPPFLARRFAEQYSGSSL